MFRVRRPTENKQPAPSLRSTPPSSSGLPPPTSPPQLDYPSSDGTSPGTNSSSPSPFRAGSVLDRISLFEFASAAAASAADESTTDGDDLDEQGRPKISGRALSISRSGRCKNRGNQMRIKLPSEELYYRESEYRNEGVHGEVEPAEGLLEREEDAMLTMSPATTTALEQFETKNSTPSNNQLSSFKPVALSDGSPSPDSQVDQFATKPSEVYRVNQPRSPIAEEVYYKSPMTAAKPAKSVSKMGRWPPVEPPQRLGAYGSIVFVSSDNEESRLPASPRQTLTIYNESADQDQIESTAL